MHKAAATIWPPSGSDLEETGRQMYSTLNTSQTFGTTCEVLWKFTHAPVGPRAAELLEKLLVSNTLVSDQTATASCFSSHIHGCQALEPFLILPALLSVPMVLLVPEDCFLSSGLQLKAREQQEQTKQTTNTKLLPQSDAPLPAIWSSGTLTLPCT